MAQQVTDKKIKKFAAEIFGSEAQEEKGFSYNFGSYMRNMSPVPDLLACVIYISEKISGKIVDAKFPEGDIYFDKKIPNVSVIEEAMIEPYRGI
jgi:hypothetical protein